MYHVEVKAIGGWTHHSAHESYKEAVDQADMVHGRIASDDAAWRWAVANQGFEGTYEDWQKQNDDQRAEYELGAAGIPTA